LGWEGDKKVLCRISRAALDDHFSDKDALRPEAAFTRHRRDIESLARRKYLLGGSESNDFVLIQTQDIG
jgi:hypothetical protein